MPEARRTPEQRELGAAQYVPLTSTNCKHRCCALSMQRNYDVRS